MFTRIEKTIASVFAFLLLIFTPIQALACTGVIVGGELTPDGNPIIGRTEDWSSSYNKMLVVNEPKTYREGELFRDEYGFSYPMPERTFRTVTIPDGYQDEGDIFEAAGWNEMGVTMTATVTATANDKALSADPFTEKGLYESSVVSIILPAIRTAREGVERLADIMDTRGLQEGAIVVIADQNEIWYMELLTGHQYVAIKYPANAYSVFPNTFMLGKINVNDKDNVIASQDLINLPREHGFLVEEEGMINVKKTYASPLSAGNRSRLWGGINFFDKDKKLPYDSPEFDLLQYTDKKISVKDVMEMQRTRYEGTEKDLTKPENEGVRPIGTVEQEEAHVIQIKKNYPRELGGVLWVAMGNAEHAMYVPVYGPILSTTAPYQVKGNLYDPSSAYWSIRQVSALSEIDRDLYGTYVREYFDQQEKQMISDQAKIDEQLLTAYKTSPQAALNLATKISTNYQEKAYADAQLIGKELNTYFFDRSGDRGVKNNRKVEAPFVPSLLGEERKMEIYRERNIPYHPTHAQPLDKGSSGEKEDLTGHWAKDIITYAVDAKYMEKVDSVYGPDRLMTVSEILAALKAFDPSFDVEKAQEALNARSIRAPYMANRQGLAYTLDVYATQKGTAKAGNGIILADTEEIQTWALPAVHHVVSKGYMGKNNAAFRPNDVVTRGQMAVVLKNMEKDR